MTYFVCILLALLGQISSGSGASTNYRSLDCRSCLSQGGSQCLSDQRFTEATCCDKDQKNAKAFACRHQVSSNTFCGNSETISNPILSNFLCPAQAAYCPDDQDDIMVIIMSKEKEYRREHTWQMEVPRQDAQAWNCKYYIKTSRSIISQYQKEKDIGYIMIQIEQYGFDEQVDLIVQPYNQFLDYTKSGAYLPQIYHVSFGSKYFIPAENSILISFKPIRSIGFTGKSPQGSIKLRLWYQERINLADKQDKRNIILYRPGSPELNEKESDEEEGTTPNRNEQKDSSGKIDSNNAEDEEDKSNKEEGVSWLEFSLFSYEGFKVTMYDAVLFGTSVIALAMMILCCCCSVSWWIRKGLNGQGDRLSAGINSPNRNPNQNYMSPPKGSYEEQLEGAPNNGKKQKLERMFLKDLFDDHGKQDPDFLASKARKDKYKLDDEAQYDALSSQVQPGFQNPDILIEHDSRKVSSMGKKTNETTAINIDGENVDSENSEVILDHDLDRNGSVIRINEIELIQSESPIPKHTPNHKNLIRSLITSGPDHRDRNRPAIVIDDSRLESNDTIKMDSFDIDIECMNNIEEGGIHIVNSNKRKPKGPDEANDKVNLTQLNKMKTQQKRQI